MTVCVNSLMRDKSLKRATENARWCCPFTLSIWYYYWDSFHLEVLLVVTHICYIRLQFGLLFTVSVVIFTATQAGWIIFLIYTCKQRLFHNIFSIWVQQFLKNKTSFQDQVLSCVYWLRWESVWQEICHGCWPCPDAPSLLPCLGHCYAQSDCGSRLCRISWPRADRERSGVRTEMRKTGWFLCIFVSRATFWLGWLSGCHTEEIPKYNGDPFATGQLGKIWCALA